MNDTLHPSEIVRLRFDEFQQAVEDLVPNRELILEIKEVAESQLREIKEQLRSNPLPQTRGAHAWYIKKVDFVNRMLARCRTVNVAKNQEARAQGDDKAILLSLHDIAQDGSSDFFYVATRRSIPEVLADMFRQFGEEAPVLISWTTLNGEQADAVPDKLWE